MTDPKGVVKYAFLVMSLVLAMMLLISPSKEQQDEQQQAGDSTTTELLVAARRQFGDTSGNGVYVATPAGTPDPSAATPEPTAPPSYGTAVPLRAATTPSPPPTTPIPAEDPVMIVPVHDALRSCNFSQPPEAFRTNESHARYETWSDVRRGQTRKASHGDDALGGALGHAEGIACYNIWPHFERLSWKEAPMFNHSHRRWLNHAHDISLDNLAVVNKTKVRRMFGKKPHESLIGHVFGGSFTAGRSPGGCNAAFVGVDCPFSNRIEKMMQQLMPDLKVAIRNYAKGGTNSKVGLGAITGVLSAKNAERPDFVLLDFSVNDLAELAPSMKDKFELAAIFEAQVATIEHYAPDAVILFVMDELWALDTNLEYLPVLLQKIALHHRTGFVNFRPACQMVGYCPFRDSAYHHVAGCEKQYNEAHPSNPVHLSMGETIVDAFVRLYLASCEGADPDVLFSVATKEVHPKKKSYTNCIIPRTHISAYSPPRGWTLTAAMNHSANDGWALVEDRPGKPGWITSTPNTSITFEVAIADRRPTMLAVTYLKSYGNVCPVELSNSVNERTARLNPKWDRRFSVSFTQWFDASDKSWQDSETGHFGFAIEPGTRFNVTLRLLTGWAIGCKFKLISIVTC